MATVDYSGDPLKFYLRELDAVPPLTSAEQVSLLRRVRTHDDPQESARKRLIEANLSLVVSVAKRHAPTGVPMLDLIREGNLGLMFAIETFAKVGGSFAAHATSCVEHFICKAISERPPCGEQM
ncbi:MAG: sigma factor [Candidatus Acidiferrales bacterium]